MSETSNEHVQGDSGPGVLDRVTDLFEKWATEENLHRVEGEFGIAEGLNIAINDLRSAVHGAPECPICGSTKPGGTPSCDCEAHRDVPTTEVTQPDPDGGVEMTDGEWVAFRGVEVTAAMKAEDVDAGLVEKAARAMWSIPPQDPDSALAWPSWDVAVERADAGLWDLPQMVADTRNLARHALAAVLPEVKRQSHREGYETARGDMASGAFIGGPTYEALRDSFTGRQIQAQALEDYAWALEAARVAWENVTTLDAIPDDLRKRAADLRAARLTATTEEPT